MLAVLNLRAQQLVRLGAEHWSAVRSTYAGYQRWNRLHVCHLRHVRRYLGQLRQCQSRFFLYQLVDVKVIRTSSGLDLLDSGMLIAKKANMAQDVVF